jgi:hypothetical protein
MTRWLAAALAAGGCACRVRLRGTVADLDSVAGEVLDGQDTEDLPDRAIYGRRVSLGRAPGLWDVGWRESRHPTRVWISSADDEGPNEADVEAGIDGAA